jgi:hypothetical protein
MDYECAPLPLPQDCTEGGRYGASGALVDVIDTVAKWRVIVYRLCRRLLLKSGAATADNRIMGRMSGVCPPVLRVHRYSCIAMRRGTDE